VQDSRVILGEVNQRISSRSLDAMTTAAVVAYYSQENKARISYAGHPPVLYKRAEDEAWSYARPPGRKGQSDGFPLNIPLAVDLDTVYGQLTISMIPGDRLFVYTDGIIDTPSPAGESFGLTRLKDVLDANAGAPLSELKSAVLKTLNQYAQKELNHDDITLIALEIC
jgi:sigma-B regulation protein RsbU (phosphoserine phosphatase)